MHHIGEENNINTPPPATPSIDIVLDKRGDVDIDEDAVFDEHLNFFGDS